MSLKNSSLDQVRINVCNNQSYVMTAALAFTTLGNAVLQGFATAAGDGGRAIFTSNITTAANFTIASGAPAFIDLIFVSTGASNANDTFQSTQSTDLVMLRCVFHGARRCGFLQIGATTGGSAYLYECEAYACNASNTAGIGAFDSADGSGGVVFCYNCYSHDNTAGVNCHGFCTGDHGTMILVNCISESNGGSGAFTGSATAGYGLHAINCNFYNNTGDGVKLAHTVGSWVVLMNNNFLLNTGKGVNATIASQGGILYNNGRGAGTQANGAVDVLQCIVNTSTDITYASNVTPWNAPTTGDFRTTLAAAKGVGRGVFTETDGSATGTIGYPDIGAAQAIVPAASGGLRLAGSGGLAA